MLRKHELNIFTGERQHNFFRKSIDTDSGKTNILLVFRVFTLVLFRGENETEWNTFENIVARRR